MNESKLQEIARLCAFCFGQDHDYTPNHADEEWQAHGWVIEAMKAALAAAPSPSPVPVDPAELAALRRDAARWRLLASKVPLPPKAITYEHGVFLLDQLQSMVVDALAANGEKGT